MKQNVKQTKVYDEQIIWESYNKICLSDKNQGPL